MNFILWLIGIVEAVFIAYFISQYISVVIQERKNASVVEEESRAKARSIAS